MTSILIKTWLIIIYLYYVSLHNFQPLSTKKLQFHASYNLDERPIGRFQTVYMLWNLCFAFLTNDQGLLSIQYNYDEIHIFSIMNIPNYFIWFVNCNPFLILNITIYLKSSNNEYLTMKKKNHMVWINKTNFILEKPLPTKFTLDKSINKRLYILVLHSYRRIN